MAFLFPSGMQPLLREMRTGRPPITCRVSSFPEMTRTSCSKRRARPLTARAGEGPSLIETSRLEGHFMGDAEGYRPEGEKSRLMALDPIAKYQERLLAEGCDEASLDGILSRAKARSAAAFDHARQSPAPDPQDAFTTVFA